MAYKQLRAGGGNYTKWDKPKTIEGRVVGYEAGEYKGKPTVHVVIQMADGVTTKCPVSVAISSVNNIEVPVGSQLKLVYKGKVTGKSGQSYNDLEAFVDVPGYVEEPPLVQASPAQVVTAPTSPLSGTTAPAAAPVVPVMDSYEADLAKLQLINPTMAKQLSVVFPDPAVRAQKLRDVLAQFGVA